MFGKLFGKFSKKKQYPETYSEAEMNAVDAHISAYFGAFNNVFHEIVSPDIHVDIVIIDPVPERNYYQLVTMGMGARCMNVPEELRDYKIDRAELVIALPPDWKIQNDDEKWYWPIRWLTILARLPGETDSWLGYGHTIPNGDPAEPFAENTQLSGMMLTYPCGVPEEAFVCLLPNGDEINFYQLLPLYDDEMNFKLANDAESLEERFPENYDQVVDIGRKSVVEE